MSKYVAMPPRNMNVEFRALHERKTPKKGVMLCKILKSGKPGKPSFNEFYSGEKTAADVIRRLEDYNPGSHWVEAEQ